MPPIEFTNHLQLQHKPPLLFSHLSRQTASTSPSPSLTSAATTATATVTTTTTSTTTMTPTSTPTKPNSKFLSFLLQAVVMALVISLFFLFVGIAALVLLHICVAGRALRRRRRRHHNQHHFFQDTDFPSGLSPKDLQNLPSFHYGSAAAAPDCSVCLESFLGGDRCRSLPGCRHVFHAACIDAWLVKVPACPVCRASVVCGGMEVNGEHAERGPLGV